MPRNGSGTYQLPAGNPVVTQTLITSAWANATMADLAAAISQSLSKDGQTVPTANLPMGGFRHTGASDPTARDSYATLGFIQDGRAARVLSLSGSSVLTGTLTGTLPAYVTGMRVQIVPIATNSGAVTLNINSLGAKPVVTAEGSALSAGNLKVGFPYELMYDGNNFVIIAGNLGAFAQGSVTGWDRPSGGTYPSITIVDPSTVAIPAGTGRIIIPGAKDASKTIEVTWAAQNVPLSYLASSWSTHIGINAAGNVVQFSGPMNPSYVRDYIMLGTAVHVDGTVTSVVTRPTIYGDAAYAAYDVASVLNNTILSGGRVSANGASPYKVDIEAGTLFSLGIDPNELNSPNVDEFVARSGPSFFPITGTSGVGTLTSDIPVTFYDPAGAGTPTTIPGTTTAVIHRLYQLNGQLLLLYGQNTYADLATAVSSIRVDTSNTNLPAKLADATLLAYIIAQKDVTNLNDSSKAAVVSAGSSEFSVGGGGAAADAPVDGNLYGRRNGNWDKAVILPNGAVATSRSIPYYTSGVLRWELSADASSESGSNAGSDFRLVAYDDLGSPLGSAVVVSRATLATTFTAALVSASSNPSYSFNASGNAADSKKSLFFLDSSGSMVFRTLNDDNSTKGEFSFTAAGALMVGANAVWHAGNFDPATKLDVGGSVASAAKLTTARLIGGVSFDGTANINLPGVNSTGNQNTTGSAASLSTPRQINGTNFNGTANITTSLWGTARTITIGSTGKSINGSVDVSWTLSEIGAVAAASPTITGTASISAANFSGAVTFGSTATFSGTITGTMAATNATFSGTVSVTGASSFSGNVTLPGGSSANTSGQILAGGAVFAAPSTALLLRPNGVASSTGQASLSTAGVMSAADFSASSDVRLKKNVIDFVDRGDLRPVQYKWAESDVADIGFIAQEVEKLYPELVYTDARGYKSISYGKLTAVLMAKLISLQARVAELEKAK